MNETGRKMTTSEKVVAITARPMSAVASLAARMGVIRFSSTKRKMFSNTTIASSITTPTISTRASIVTPLRVKFIARIIANHFHLHVGRQLGGDVRQLVLDVMNYFYCVRARLPANLERDGRHSVQT